MKLKFLGTTSSTPDPHEDCPCFLVNETYLFDCGFHVAGALTDTGCDFSKIRYIIFTHMHHDHYIGLAGLLFQMIHYGAIHPEKKLPRLDELTILGPSDDIERVLKLTYDFLQLDTFYPELGRPTVIPVVPGQVFETDDALIEAGMSRHPVDARCYRFTDKTDGTVLAATGDTLYTPQMADFFAGAKALIHDSTLGAVPGIGSNGHSTIYEAIRTAENAKIDTLFPVHMTIAYAKASVEAAQDRTAVKIIAPQKGTEYII